MDKTFKDLIADIKCGKIAPPSFTESDLAKVKLCIPEPAALPAKDFNLNIPQESSCVNEGVDAAKKILVDQLKKQPTVIEAGLIKGKIEEALDHYEFILRYYQVRVDFFTQTIDKIESFTAQHFYWDTEYTRLAKIASDYFDKINSDKKVNSVTKGALLAFTKLSDDNIVEYSKNKKNLSKFIGAALASILKDSEILNNYLEKRLSSIEAAKNREVAKVGANTALSQQIEKIPILGEAHNVRADIISACSEFSGQLIPNFEKSEISPFSGLAVPPRTLVFGIRLIDLDSTKATIPVIKEDGSATQSEKIVKIRTNPLLKHKPFKTTQATYCESIDSSKENKPTRNYDYVPGALYNKRPSGYPGLYRKFANPISLLFTPEERGLSVDPNQIDPLIKDVQNAPVSIKEGQVTLYIKSQAKYEAFYEKLNEVLPDKIKKEREEVFPTEIKDAISKLETIALQEVSDFFRQTTDIAVRLARPVSYKSGQSDIFTQGEFKYSELDKVVSGKLAYYIKAADQIKEVINECKLEIDNLNAIIKENSMDKDILSKKISEIPCFKEAAKTKAANPDCEAKTLAKLGTDPLFIRTLDGTDASLPDMTNPCYWREFTKSLNKVSILPFPDLTSQLFRYYPINNIIPTPLGIIMIPIPQRWIHLFSLSTPVGTLVTFLTMPIAIVGIPLPSVYVFYFAPDGRKYLLLAPNIPLLYPTNSLKYGFEVDDSQASQNPLGINPSDPYKGQLVKGSLSIPLKISAGTSKASRLAMIAAKVALGEPMSIVNGAGLEIGKIDPITYAEKYLSMNEKILNGADFDPVKDFDRQVNEFRRSIGKQFDRLGEMQIQAVSQLKEKTRQVRDKAVKDAENAATLKDKRELKKKARSLDPVQLNQKISSVLDDFEKYIDKIKLGTIKFPDDPTKLNPKLPAAITGLQPIIAQATKGELVSDRDSTNFLAKLRRSAAQIDVSTLKSKKVFDLTKSEDLANFKDALKEYSTEAIAYLTGDKSPVEAVDPNLSPEQKAAIAKAAALRKKRLKQALAFTSLSVVAPKLKLFDPSAPCCQTDSELTDLSISPQIIAIIGVFNSLFDAFLDGLTLESLRGLVGESLSNISISTISSLFDSILTAFPPLVLPEKPDLLAISQAVLIPVLSALHIPQAPNPLGIPFPVQVSIPLDAIIKPILKAAVAYLLELILRLLSDASSMLLSNNGKDSTNDIKEIINTIPCGDSQVATVSTTNVSNFVDITLPGGIKLKLPKIPTIPLDIVSYFALLTSTDLVELIRSLIFAAIDGILKPLRDVITPILGLTRSLKDLSFNIIEAGNPFILPLKLAMMVIQLAIPNSVKLRLANFDAINAVKLAYLPVVKAAEPVLKEVNYLAALSACAFGSKPGVQIARVAASPFFNQDDLPPWERLTHKNPLFAIFLDEIAWRTSLMSTGSLIFKTKMPGLYPTSLVVNVVVDSGRHIG